MLFHLVDDPTDPQGAQSRVVGIDHIPELVDWSVANLRRDGLGAALDDGRLKIVTGDGRKGVSDALLVSS